ncbi:nitrite reductase small subunit NirD [Acidihalobacter prosperus]|uniref:Nitrite reductase [NAD(P)H] small subunit n=1 Tax=Acidihalobacter prosperus TaxID=160660 RepID=A0A1A6C2U0_9GAMM|nr:nitrite reductase small subunit NirD [Acidihalobacter prosperus]OBS08876.1 Nitrite reductase [NAD(P)H] small subunit [Acidihalobacter prosperus]
MKQWIDIAALSDVPRLGARVVAHGEDEIAVFRAADDAVFALHNRCPHRNGPLSEGIVHGHRVTCPLHNWVIELDRGEAVAPDSGSTACYPVRVENGRILLELETAAEAAHG